MERTLAGMPILIATREEVLVVEPSLGTVARGDPAAATRGRDAALPTCLAADPSHAGRAWCGTSNGVLRSEDAGMSWVGAGLEGEEITAIAASPNERGEGGAVVYAGTEPSAVHVSADGGGSWRRSEGLLDLPSSSTWSFPPKPQTHHVRWIACDPATPGRLYVAIEAGPPVSSPAGGAPWRARPRTAPSA